jgi:preprotein translocase subunit SecG
MSDESTQNPPSRWEQFQELIGLHKFYFEHIIKGAAISFGIVGAIVSYLLASDVRDGPGVRLALVVPILLSFGSFFVALLGAMKTYDLSAKVQQLQGELRLSWRPHAEVLPAITGVFAALFLIVAVALVWVSLEPERLPKVVQPKRN